MTTTATLPTQATTSNGKPFEVVWQPLPGRVINGKYYPSSQALALDTRADQTLYHGTRGPGKTTTQLANYRRYVGLGYGEYWRGIIFGYEYKNLDDLLQQSKKMFLAFEDGARFYESQSAYLWEWPTGEQLLFRSGTSEASYPLYHGHEYPFQGWNELTNWVNLKFYDAMQSCNRSSWTQEKDSPQDENGNYTLPPIPLKTFSTTNSEGIGFAAVKRRFIDPAPNGKIVTTPVEVFNPKTQRNEIYNKTQVAIFGSYKENIYLDAQYIASLHSQTDPAKRSSWLTGSWEIVSGGALDDVWRKSVHVKPRKYQIPADWYVDRSFDWGSTHPAWCGWWALATGETLTSFKRNRDGSFDTWTPAPGSLILIHEYYFYKGELGDNEGMKLGAVPVAETIRDTEIALMQDGWILRQPVSGPADNQIRDVHEASEENIETKMASVGIRWEESDKSPGSRRNGLQLLRDRLTASELGEGPGFYVFDHCRAFIALTPVLPRDKVKRDDVDTTAEDHPYDGARYRVLKGTYRTAKNITVQFAR
jgi:hypothetical protein